jgi:hypothetical protein
MATFTKLHLSGSIGGQPIPVGANSDPGTIIHTTETSSSTLDEVWIYANNNDVSDAILNIAFGGVVDPDNIIEISIAAGAGLVLVIPGLTLSGDGTAGRQVQAFSQSQQAINITGYVNRIA